MSAKRGAAASSAPPPPKRERPAGGAAAAASALQRELQLERERHGRSQDSVEQLRLEVQMLGRLLASTRERLAACGERAFEPGLVVRAPPNVVEGGALAGPRPAGGRSKADAKLLQRLQEELAESRGQSQRLTQQLEMQERKMQLVAGAKQELMATVAEMTEYLASHR